MSENPGAGMPDAPLESAEVHQPLPEDEGMTTVLEPGPAPAPDPVAAAAPNAVSATRAGGSRARWLVAAIVVVAVIGAAVAAAAFLAARPLPEALRYIAADSGIVLELRPELPGDQRQHLGNFLAHFPGFADQSTLSEKIDEALGRLVTRAGNGAIDYAKQVKPLLAGPMAVSMSAADLTEASSGKTPVGLLLVATTDGKATCSSIIGTPTTKGETYREVTLEVVGASGGESCALDGRFLLYGMPAAIERGIDAHLDGKGIDGDARFRSARERLSGDQTALAYLSGRAVSSTLATLAPSLGTDTAVKAALPEWVAAGIRVVDDAIQVEVVTPPSGPTAAAGPSGLPTAPPPAKSHFAALLPATAFGFVEAHGMGANLQRVLAQLQATPSQAGPLGQLQTALGSLGGVGNLVGWIEDLGVAGIPVGDGAGAVVLIRGADAGAAQGRLDQLRNLLAIASVGTDISVTTADHSGTPVTSVDLGDLGPTLESLGAPAGLLPSGSHVKFTMAVRGGVLLLGVGDGVLEAVLDTSTATSLAGTAAYGHAIDLAGTPNDLEVFLAIDTIAGWLEAHPPAGTDLTDFKANIKPYLDHLAGASESSVTTSSGAQARLVITVK